MRCPPSAPNSMHPRLGPGQSRRRLAGSRDVSVRCGISSLPTSRLPNHTQKQKEPHSHHSHNPIKPSRWGGQHRMGPFLAEHWGKIGRHQSHCKTTSRDEAARITLNRLWGNPVALSAAVSPAASARFATGNRVCIGDSPFVLLFTYASLWGPHVRTPRRGSRVPRNQTRIPAHRGISHISTILLSVLWVRRGLTSGFGSGGRMTATETDACRITS